MSFANLLTENNYQLYCQGLTFGTESTPLQNYFDSGYDTNLTGAINSSTIGLFREIGGVCTISCNPVTSAFVTAAPITFTTPLADYAWTITQFPINVINNGVNVAGTLQIGDLGVIKIFVGSDVTNGNFTGGTCGFNGFSVSYCSYV